MKSLMMLLLLVGCATKTPEKKKKLIPDSISNQDFNKPKQIKYNSRDDYFKEVDNLDTALLNDESVARLDDFSDITDEDVFSSIAKLCYAKEYDKSFQIIRKNYDRYRSNPVFWNQVGNCYLRKKSYRKALLFYNKSLENKKNYVPALNNIGVMYWYQGEHQKASVAFEKASRAGRFTKTPRFNLALLYLQFGLSNKAISSLESLLLLGKTDVDVKSALVSAHLMNGNIKQSVGYCNSLSGKFSKVHIGLNCVVAYLRDQNLSKAKDVFADINNKNLGPWENYYSKIKRELML